MQQGFVSITGGDSNESLKEIPSMTGGDIGGILMWLF